MAKIAKSNTWQLQTAKAQFSELFQRALTDGPQRVTRRGKESVVILSVEEYEARRAGKKRPERLGDFLRRTRVGELNIERSKDIGRTIEFEL